MATKSNCEPTIHFAPLQGYTDNDYREAHFQIIGSVDNYYSPYLSLENDGSIKAVNRILPNDHLHKPHLIPQILPASLNDLKQLLPIIIDSNFTKININLGCPYPMVTHRGKGAALLRNPKLVNIFLDYLQRETSLSVSLKLRSGMESHDELFPFLHALNLSLVNQIIVHPRTAKQLYKGKADVSVFTKCYEEFPTLNLVYNGDIDCFERFQELKMELPFQHEWMIGRGLIANPFLAWQIKNQSSELPINHNQLLFDFCNQLYRLICSNSNDEHHALNRVRTQLMAILETDTVRKKLLKQIKKAKSIKEIERLIQSLI